MQARFVLAALLVAACSSAPPTVSMNITASGGSVKTTDGTSVVVPAGAVIDSTAITISGEPNAITVGDVVLVGPAYRFGPEGTQFAVPVTVTLAYDPSKLPAGTSAADVEVMTAPVGSTAFVVLPTTIVDATHVTADTSHFSDFVATAKKKKAPMDQGVVIMDLGVAPSDQGSTPNDEGLASADQSTPADAASSGCPHNWQPAQCSLTANATTCGGSYSLNCLQTMCVCSGGAQKVCPKPSPYTNTTTCPPQADVETMWTGCCGYP
jgi:hypothetical protein